MATGLSCVERQLRCCRREPPAFLLLVVKQYPLRGATNAHAESRTGEYSATSFTSVGAVHCCAVAQAARYQARSWPVALLRCLSCCLCALCRVGRLMQSTQLPAAGSGCPYCAATIRGCAHTADVNIDQNAMPIAHPALPGRALVSEKLCISLSVDDGSHRPVVCSNAAAQTREP